METKVYSTIDSLEKVENDMVSFGWTLKEKRVVNYTKDKRIITSRYIDNFKNTKIYELLFSLDEEIKDITIKTDGYIKLQSTQFKKDKYETPKGFVFMVVAGSVIVLYGLIMLLAMLLSRNFLGNLAFVSYLMTLGLAYWIFGNEMELVLVILAYILFAGIPIMIGVGLIMPGSIILRKRKKQFESDAAYNSDLSYKKANNMF